jgi:AraC-like DNA-binding protein
MNASYSPMSSRLDRPAQVTSVDMSGGGRGYERSMAVYPILHLKPPYTASATAVMVREVDASKIVPGSVLALHITARNIDWSECSETVRGLRHRLPSVPVVLSLGPDIPDGLFLARQATRASVRAVVSGAAPLGESLRRPLTDTQTLGADVVEWLGLFGIRLTPTLNHLVSHIFSDAPRFREVADLLRDIGAAESSTRFRFRKKGLPAPSRWLQAARGLHAALRIQLEPERSILAHACDLGYADHSALCHQMRRLFGTTPAAVRGTLGWEWLLERWVRNNVLAGKAPPAAARTRVAVREPV